MKLRIFLLASLIVTSVSAPGALAVGAAGHCPEQQGKNAQHFVLYTPPGSQTPSKAVQDFNRRLLALSVSQYREIISRRKLQINDKRIRAGGRIEKAIQASCRLGHFVADSDSWKVMEPLIEFGDIDPRDPGDAAWSLEVARLLAVEAIIARGVADDRDVRLLYAPFQKSIPIESLRASVSHKSTLQRKPIPASHPMSNSTSDLKTAEPCAEPHVAAIATHAEPPDYPDIARQQGASGSTLVMVTLDSRGHVLRATIYQSSGNDALDNAALGAARASRYSPQIEDCQAIGGDYIFHADFNKP